MFFETTDFSVRNVGAFEFLLDYDLGHSGIRPYNALSLRIYGEASFSFNNQVVDVIDGDIVFVPAGLEYYIDANKEHLIVIHFETDKALSDTIERFRLSDSSLLKQLFKEIASAYSAKERGYEYVCKSLLYKIIGTIQKGCEQQALHFNDRLQNAMDYIHSHYQSQNISICDLAERCFLSETYFRKLFSSVYGCSPLEYINRLRTDHAVGLLKTGYYTVAQVSQLCGFSSPYYFSNFIKERTDRSPSEYLK